MKQIILMLSIFLAVSCTQNINETKDKEEITTALLISAEEWTKGDLEGFMDVYWNSEKLQFVGSNGLTFGWQQTLDNYKKGYPNKDYTGTLNFNILNIDFLAKDVYLLTGEYHLDRKVGNADGIFTLIFKKIKGKWQIIADHSD